MQVKSLVNGLDLTEGKIYEVIHEYDTVYELNCDTGRYCRAKEFFQLMDSQKDSKNIPVPSNAGFSLCFNKFDAKNANIKDKTISK